MGHDLPKAENLRLRNFAGRTLPGHGRRGSSQMAELVYRPVVGAALTLFKALDLKIDTQGSEHIPRTGGAVLVSNHISYLDFIFTGLAALPQKRLVRFMAKDSVFRHKVSGPLMRGMKHIPVDRAQGEHAYKHALESLRAARSSASSPRRPSPSRSRSRASRPVRRGSPRRPGSR